MTAEHSAPDRLKARLIGAVALLLIGVVGWFWLLDVDNPVEPVAQESAIPPAPAIQPFTVPEPQAPAGIKPVGSERDAAAAAAPAPAPVPPQPAAASATPAPAPKPAAKPAPAPAERFELDGNDLPVAWVVQVGAMSSQAGADKLKEQLIAKGFKAYTQPSQLANGNPVVKVFVGPKLSRERADAQKKAIDAAFKTSAMVVRFPPS